MFGIDFPELVVIGVVALVVLGPERLPKAARFVGLWVRRARGQWNSVKSELERELAADEFRRTLHDTEKAMRDIDADVRAADADARREFDAMRKAASANGSAAATAADPLPASPDIRAPEPFDTLADFDPNALDPLSTATRATEADVTGTPGQPPAASSAFAAAAAALGRQQADAELSAAAVMTGPNPPASSLAHASSDAAVPDAGDTVDASRPRTDTATRDGHDVRSA